MLFASAVTTAAAPRAPWTSNRVIGSPNPPAPFAVERVFPKITLEHPVDLGLMTHFVRNTVQGCEIRSRFFLGHVAGRGPDHPIPPDAARALRHENVTADLARRLHQHATEEMSYLTEILPVLYRQVTQDQML